MSKVLVSPDAGVTNLVGAFHLASSLFLYFSKWIWHSYSHPYINAIITDNYEFRRTKKLTGASQG